MCCCGLKEGLFTGLVVSVVVLERWKVGEND